MHYLIYLKKAFYIYIYIYTNSFTINTNNILLKLLKYGSSKFILHWPLQMVASALLFVANDNLDQYETSNISENISMY